MTLNPMIVLDPSTEIPSRERTTPLKQHRQTTRSHAESSLPPTPMSTASPMMHVAAGEGSTACAYPSIGLREKERGPVAARVIKRERERERVMWWRVHRRRAATEPAAGPKKSGIVSGSRLCLCQFVPLLQAARSESRSCSQPCTVERLSSLFAVSWPRRFFRRRRRRCAGGRVCGLRLRP